MACSVRNEHRVFGGRQGFYEHESAACGGAMRFSVFVPEAGLGNGAKLPVLYWLAGLTCTEETFVVKAGAQRVAAELGLVLVTCDTSPACRALPRRRRRVGLRARRGLLPRTPTEAPWSGTYRLETYVTTELRELVETEFPVRPDARGIFGHSMGGHGALTLSLRHPDLYATVSAFAPISSPSQVPWGQKAFTGYLGADRTTWAAHDATALVASGKRFPSTPLVDQGLADKFLTAELRPEIFEEACREADQPLELLRHEGYDHSYFFHPEPHRSALAASRRETHRDVNK